MIHNHDFINSATLAIKQAVKGNVTTFAQREWGHIARAFHIFTESLLTHIEEEDSILYQHAQNNIGTNGLFYRLLSDHLQIKETVQECQQALSSNDTVHFIELFQRLDKIIEEHTIREETLMGMHSKNLEESAVRVISMLCKLHEEKSVLTP